MTERPAARASDADSERPDGEARPRDADEGSAGAAGDAPPGDKADADGRDPAAESLDELFGPDGAALREETARIAAIVADSMAKERVNVSIGSLTMFQDQVEVGGGFSIGGKPSSSGRAAASGVERYDDAALDFHLDHYVHPTGYGSTLRLLREHRLLVLATRPGSGREATAVNLLAEALAAHGLDGRACYRVTEAALLAGADWTPPVPKAGYVVALDTGGGDRGPLPVDLIDEHWIQALATRVADTSVNGFLVVLTGSPQGALLEAAAHSRHVVTTLGEIDPVAIIARRVLGPAPDPDDLADLRHALDAANALNLMAAHPGPCTAVRLANALRGGEDLSETVRRLSDPTGHVHAWFGRHRGSEAISFALATAALEGAGYLTVSDAAVALYRLLEPEAVDPPDLRFLDRLDAEHTWIELTSGADGDAIGGGGVPRIRFRDRYVPSAVLEYAWLSLDGRRSAFLRWLQQLTDHHDLEVRTRAAVTAGTIAGQDFHHALHRYLRGWAGSSSRRSRIAAAAALVIVASRPELTEQVWRQLEQWAREGGSQFQKRLRLTAAEAVGGPLGASQPKRAMRVLREVIDDDWYGLVTVGLAVLQLIELGCEAEALAALLEWSRPQDDSALVAQALSVFALVALAPVPWHRAADGRPGQPLIIADGGRHRLPMEELWARSLARKPAQTHALAALRDFLTDHADTDPAVLKAIERVLLGVASRGGRHRQRLEWYLGEWARDPLRPSRSAAVIRRRLAHTR